MTLCLLLMLYTPVTAAAEAKDVSRRPISTVRTTTRLQPRASDRTNTVSLCSSEADSLSWFATLCLHLMHYHPLAGAVEAKGGDPRSSANKLGFLVVAKHLLVHLSTAAG